MNTLEAHKEEFESGIVTEMGYAAMAEAERYDAASAIGAGSVSIALLWKAFRQGKTLFLYSRDLSSFRPTSESELRQWCDENFPVCYAEHLRRSKH